MSHDENLIESGFGDYVDPYEFLRDDEINGWRTMGVMTDMISDRRGGQDRPIFQNERELADIRAWGRFLTTRLPLGVTVLENLVNYTIGKGWSYRVRSREDQQLRDAAQRVVDRFIEENDWAGGLERELYARSVIDGEYFLLIEHGQSAPRAVVIEPASVTQPMSPEPLEDWLGCEHSPCCWRFGVHSRERDTSRALGYHVVYDTTGGDWEYYRADQLEHFKRNTPRNVKRGVSDYFPVRDVCLDSAKLLRNTMRGAQVQAGIAYIRKFAAGTTQAQVQSLMATKRYDETTQHTPLGNRTRNVDKIEPGTIINTGNHDYVPGPSAENAPAFIEVVQAGLRYLGARWCMPEYMISADASNNNYSSSLVSEAPFVKAREHDQSRLATSFRRVLWRVLKCAWERGSLGSASWDAVESTVELVITPPDVASHDRTSFTQASATLHQAGVLSPRTWAAREGLDYDDEVAAGAKPQDVSQPQTHAFGESFDETKHPRGQPGNAGQFGSSGAGEADRARDDAYMVHRLPISNPVSPGGKLSIGRAVPVLSPSGIRDLASDWDDDTEKALLGHVWPDNTVDRGIVVANLDKLSDAYHAAYEKYDNSDQWEDHAGDTLLHDLDAWGLGPAVVKAVHAYLAKRNRKSQGATESLADSIRDAATKIATEALRETYP